VGAAALAANLVGAAEASAVAGSMVAIEQPTAATSART
jgi:hypothetical protein